MLRNEFHIMKFKKIREKGCLKQNEKRGFFILKESEILTEIIEQKKFVSMFEREEKASYKF